MLRCSHQKMLRCAVVFLAFLAWGDTKKEDELVAVVTLFRHGDRSPTTSFPNDAFFHERYWPMGYGQLTNIGKMRMYELGKWFRKRYSSFLQDEYSPKDVYIRSTNSDRCLMSAYAVTAGLFPAKGTLMWNKDLLWQPIPVHTIPINIDEILSMSKPCLKYRKLLEDAKTSEYVQNVISECSDIFQIVSKHSGWKETNIDSVATLQLVLDAYGSYNRSFIPKWAHLLNKRRLSLLTAVNQQRYTLTPEMKRLLTGPFWFDFLSHLDNVINNVSGTPKFFMMSAHDRTIVSLMNGMGVFDLVPPPFGATLIWELRRNDAGKHYINLFYKRSGNEADILNFKKCGVNCEYGVFKGMLMPLIIESEDWEMQCRNGLSKLSKRISDKKPFFT